jgi:glutamyl-tRNA reductase
MSLASIKLVHFRKTASYGDRKIPRPGFIPEDAFCLETCQRTLWMFFSNESAQTEVLEEYKEEHEARYEIRCGAEAYLMLLLVGCGLDSELKGETEVFGQLKLAWHHYIQTESQQRALLLFWMQKVFEDIKQVRARFLQSTGGACYGSLIRKQLRQHTMPGQRVLLVGAGELARSVVPWLSDYQVSVVNRGREAAFRLVEDALRNQPGFSVEIGNDNSWSEARHVVICIPRDPELDVERISRLESRADKGVVIHMGCRREDADKWRTAGIFYCLDDFFDLQANLSKARKALLAAAKEECERLACSRIGLRREGPRINRNRTASPCA